MTDDPKFRAVIYSADDLRQLAGILEKNDVVAQFRVDDGALRLEIGSLKEDHPTEFDHDPLPLPANSFGKATPR